MIFIGFITERGQNMEGSRTVKGRDPRVGVLCLAAFAGLPMLGAGSTLAVDLPPIQEQRIDITINNSTYVRTKTMPIRAGLPTALVIRNEDPVTHGFVSAMFSGLRVTAGVQGGEVFGTGIEGVHVDAGATVVIRLTPDRQGKMTFRCDLHPTVQGELYLLDVPVG